MSCRRLSLGAYLPLFGKGRQSEPPVFGSVSLSGASTHDLGASKSSHCIAHIDDVIPLGHASESQVTNLTVEPKRGKCFYINASKIFSQEAETFINSKSHWDSACILLSPSSVFKTSRSYFGLRFLWIDDWAPRRTPVFWPRIERPSISLSASLTYGLSSEQPTS